VIDLGAHGGISESELTFTYARSGGPGGQHVNKVSTKVILQFDLDGSESLSGAQKNRIREKLAGRINREGILQVACDSRRSRALNQEEAIRRFAELLLSALKRPRPRKKTGVSRAQKEKRLEEKKKRGRLKQDRRGFD